jgi:hypothetical protein
MKLATYRSAETRPGQRITLPFGCGHVFFFVLFLPAFTHIWSMHRALNPSWENKKKDREQGMGPREVID